MQDFGACVLRDTAETVHSLVESSLVSLKLEQMFFNLYFWRNCYVTNISSDNRNVQITTQSLNSFSIPQPEELKTFFPCQV